MMRLSTRRSADTHKLYQMSQEGRRDSVGAILPIVEWIMPIQQPCVSEQSVLEFDSCRPAGLMMRYALTNGLTGALRWMERVRGYQWWHSADGLETHIGHT